MPLPGTPIPGTGKDLLDGGAIIPDIRVRDMGPDTMYAKGAGQIPP